MNYYDRANAPTTILATRLGSLRNRMALRPIAFLKGEIMFQVKEISDMEAAFPADVKRLMPKWEEIPEEFKKFGGTPWNAIFNEWFYSGLKDMKAVPKPGVDRNKALRHILTIMRSYEPKHEHKEAAVSFLMSEWFESITYDKGGFRK